MTDELTITNLATEINSEHNLCKEAMQKGVLHALRCGELLLRAKDLVEHGEWLPWLSANCEFSERTAQAYMRIAVHWPELEKAQRVADLSFRDALQLVAENRDPMPDRFDELEKTVSNGMMSYVEVGQAFKNVRDRQLYKPDYASFGEYCEGRWGMSERKATEYINTSGITAALNNIPRRGWM